MIIKLGALPVELAVPFGGGIRIESPDVLRQELLDRCREAMEANGVVHASQFSEPEQLSGNRRFFSSRLSRD